MDLRKVQSLQALADSPIGIFDSGLGGLTVLRAIREALPSEKCVYLGDSARTPYGSKGKGTIMRYSLECAGFLLEQEVKLVVVACNTASALALPFLTDECNCPVVGTIDPVVTRALKLSPGYSIGVIGTPATIASAVYEQRIKELEPSARVTSIACPLFVPLVEQGMFGGEIVEKVVALYLEELRAADIDTLILGCTHYPLLREVIQNYMGPDIEILECSDAVAEEVKFLLNAGDGHSREQLGNEKYFVTDEVSRFNALAELFLDRRNVQAVQLEELHGPMMMVG